MMHFFFGTRKYTWLIERKQKALIFNENIDDFYLQTFASIDLSQHHTQEDYNDLIQILVLRRNAEKPDLLDRRALCINQVFTLEFICTLALKITPDTPLIVWEIIYRMMQLYCPSYGCNAPLLYKVLQRLEDKIYSRENRIYGLLSTISILITSEDKSFGYITFFLQVIRKRLNQRRPYTIADIYPSVPFTEIITINMQNSLRNLRNLEKL